MLLVRLLEHKPIAHFEELVLNAVSAITNLSFYHQPLNAVLQHETVAKLLVPLLLHDNHEAKLECARYSAHAAHLNLPWRSPCYLRSPC